MFYHSQAQHRWQICNQLKITGKLCLFKQAEEQCLPVSNSRKKVHARNKQCLRLYLQSIEGTCVWMPILMVNTGFTVRSFLLFASCARLCNLAWILPKLKIAHQESSLVDTSVCKNFIFRKFYFYWTSHCIKHFYLWPGRNQNTCLRPLFCCEQFTPRIML